MSFLPYAIDEVVASVRADYFPLLTVETPVVFADGRPIACIADAGSATPVIYIHPALSRPETPPEVLRFIIKHELLHIEVPSVRSGRRVLHHPPAFWEREWEIAPESRECWAWLRQTLGDWLVVNHGAQSAEVRVRRRRPRKTSGRSRVGTRRGARTLAVCAAVSATGLAAAGQFRRPVPLW